MITELDVYKQNRINELTRLYHSNVARLYSILIINVRNVQLSRNRNKPQLINALVTKYNNDVNILRRNLTNSINQVNSFKSEFVVAKPNNKKALLIGINYINTDYELSGCINDTNKMKDFLTERGFNSFRILTDLTEVKPTRLTILNELKNMLINSQSGDVLFFYFSGHGSYTYDRNGDEIDGNDEMIVSCDLKAVLDDELKSVISKYMKRDVTIVGMFDSCNSGTMFDLKYNYLDSNNYDKYTENDKVSECNGNVIMISGCMDSQTSAESWIDNKAQGAMTWSFVETINKAPNCSWRELLKSMRELLKNNSFSQIPQISTDSFYDIDSKLFI